MTAKERSLDLISFIDKSPSPFHAVQEISRRLEQEGFVYLPETEAFPVVRGGKYYTKRNGSSIIAFRIPQEPKGGFQILASHSDSPSFKIKGENPFLEDGNYTRLNVERYGGMIMAPWLDRPLGIAGRVIVRTEDGVRSELVDSERNLTMIPNMPIHLSRKMNESLSYDAQKDMLPVIGGPDAKEHFFEALGCSAAKEDILGMDLFLYNRVPATFYGMEEEYVGSARLDDLQCAYGTLEGFLAAEGAEKISVYCVFDNEEVGSSTKQGAASTFLADTLERIWSGLGGDSLSLKCAVADSFLVSADNAHAQHPAHPENYDPSCRVYMNKGIVIKQSANQKYTTDAMSEAVTKKICQVANVPYQIFANHSNIPGGSTLGGISTSQVSAVSVDIGLAQLAMHSPYETAGTLDTEYLVQFIKKFCETPLHMTEDGFTL
ncbi:M18 family aminopeptidase [Lacrimispora saccharolytica]|nr:M18 family aminopeptidase [Lacrimispora saccharolytica]